MEKTETMKHTKEPWVAEKTLQGRNSSISNSRGKTIAMAYKNENIDGDALANAKRIVACVNACAGITNDALEEGIVLDSVKLHEAILDQQPSSFFKEYGVKVWEDV